jgi:hypothetical protein
MLHKGADPWIPDKPEIRLLLRLAEFRRRIVAQRVRLSNELTQLLKMLPSNFLDNLLIKQRVARV